MAKKASAASARLQGVVDTYFGLIRDLRSGDPASVPKLMSLWDLDGVFEFAGSPPVVGTYRGAAAIQTLYKNRLNSSGMALECETKRNKAIDVSLGVVDTEVTHTKANGNRIVAAWRTTVGTTQGHGFDVAGSHLFTFEGDKIKSLRIMVSPKPDPSHLKELRMEELSVNDVGRLSLAAWAVV